MCIEADVLPYVYYQFQLSKTSVAYSPKSNEGGVSGETVVEPMSVSHEAFRDPNLEAMMVKKS